jgi:hypothetical protein
LNKFHSATPAIQALWLVVILLTVRHLASVIGRILETALRILALRAERPNPAEYAIYREPNGRWMLSIRGQRRELSPEDVARLAPP